MPITRDDLSDLRNDVREGFSGIHARLDITNGRIGKAEVDIAQHDVRIKNVEREVFHRRRDDRDDRSDDDQDRRRDYDDRAITQRDVRVVFITLGSAGSVILFFWKILPALLAAMK